MKKTDKKNLSFRPKRGFFVVSIIVLCLLWAGAHLTLNLRIDDRLDEAKIELKKGNYQEAENIVQEVMEKHESNTRSYVIFYNILIDQRRFEQASKIADKILLLEHDLDQTFIENFIVTKHHAGDFEGVLRLEKQLNETEELDWLTCLSLADSYSENDLYKSAIQYQKLALSQKEKMRPSEWKEACYNLANYHLRLELHDEAAIYFEASLHSDNDEWTIPWLIKFYGDSKKYKEMINYIELASENLDAEYLISFLQHEKIQSIFSDPHFIDALSNNAIIDPALISVIQKNITPLNPSPDS